MQRRLGHQLVLFGGRIVVPVLDDLFLGHQPLGPQHHADAHEEQHDRRAGRRAPGCRSGSSAACPAGASGTGSAMNATMKPTPASAEISERQRDAALGALLGLRAADREALAAVDDVDAVGLGAGEHRLFGRHLAHLVRGRRLGRAWVVAASSLASSLRSTGSTIISAPTPPTQITIASDTGPMRSMPLPPGSLDALRVWM